MTVPDHFQLQTGSPIYCLDWLADDILVYAGGGGKSRTGVGNYLVSGHSAAFRAECMLIS